MVYGDTSYHHRTALHVCRRRTNAIYHQDIVLRNHVIPFSHQPCDMYTFQQDIVRAHTEPVTTQYLTKIMFLCLNDQHCPLIYRL